MTDMLYLGTVKNFGTYTIWELFKKAIKKIYQQNLVRQ